MREHYIDICMGMWRAGTGVVDKLMIHLEVSRPASIMGMLLKNYTLCCAERCYGSRHLYELTTYFSKVLKGSITLNVIFHELPF